MTEAQAIEQIFEAWKTGWEALHPTIPYTLDDESFTGVPQWARVSVVHTTRTQVSIGPVGARRFESRGNIMVQLFNPPDAGRTPLAALADDVRSILESTTIGATLGEPVRTYGGRTQDVASTKKDAWAMLVVVVPISYFETR